MRHSGYQVGIRKKLSSSPDQVWDFFTGPKGLSIWLELPQDLTPVAQGSLTLDSGCRLEWVECLECELLSFKYRLPDWESESKVHIRILDKHGICVIHILQENIPDTSIREEIKNKLEKILIPEFSQ